MSRQASPQTVHATTTETRPRSVLASHIDEDLDDDDEDGDDDDDNDDNDDGSFSQSTRRTLESDCDDDILTSLAP